MHLDAFSRSFLDIPLARSAKLPRVPHRIQLMVFGEFLHNGLQFQSSQFLLLLVLEVHDDTGVLRTSS